MEPVNPKRVFPTAAEITVGAALGCNIAWVSMSFKSMSLFASYHHGESLLDTTYLISIIAVTLTLALAGIADRATGRFLKSSCRFTCSLSACARPRCLCRLRGSRESRAPRS